MSNQIINFIVFCAQGIVTFVTLVTIYLIFVLLDYQGGIDGFIATTFIQPIFGGILSALTIVICLVIGLPIRIHKKLNKWWSNNYYISILGIVSGFTLILIAFLPIFTELELTNDNGTNITKEIPNLTLVVSGWFIICFFILHTFPTEKIKEVVKRTAEQILSPA